MSAKVRFSVLTETGQISFCRLSEIPDKVVRDQLVHQIMLWSQSVRELGIRRAVANELSDEWAKRAIITFDPPSTTRTGMV